MIGERKQTTYPSHGKKIVFLKVVADDVLLDASSVEKCGNTTERAVW